RGGHVVHGQNWDWNPGCEDTAVVVHIKQPDAPDILTFVEAGQLARSGMNAAGVALTANGLQAAMDAGRFGAPNPFVRRRLLMQTHLAGAIGVVLNAQVSSSHNLAISHKGGEAFQFEVTPDETFWLEPEGGVLVHANHFKSDAARAKLVDHGLTRCPESLYRDRRAAAFMAAHAGDITADTLKEAFKDTYGAPHAILRAPAVRPGGNLSGTVASVVMTPGEGRLELAKAPYRGEITYSAYHLDVA
ncbi:MAG: C45 family peptidase, partial [Caulobacterales bacterium]|nr:C45 family peptidase [Caulobacterales bacterium]